jgi:hypothetical protein
MRIGGGRVEGRARARHVAGSTPMQRPLHAFFALIARRCFAHMYAKMKLNYVTAYSQTLSAQTSARVEARLCCG